MTKVRMLYQEQLIKGFVVEGHSGYAKHGEDIVCAAISAIVQTTVIGIQDVLNAGNIFNEADARIRLELETKEYFKLMRAQLLFKTMLLALLDIAKQYPNNLQVEYMETINKEEE